MKEPDKEEAPRNDVRKPRDGTLDFSSYSPAQLRDLESLIDPVAQPLNHARLQAEISRRAATSSPAALPGIAGRFTVHDGWRGWWQAKRRHSPVYGGGSVEISPAGLTLHGSQRTWLGMVTPGVIEIPSDRVRNVALDRDCLHFEIRRRFLPARRLRFQAGSDREAAELAGQLPKTRSKGFDRRWREVRQFNERVAALGGNAWLVYALVIINVGLFAAMAVSYGRPGDFDTQWMVRWGANFGPVTMNGQWWRLLSAQFLHFDIFHLVANMWVLWNAGRLARQLYGSSAFLGIYLGSGVCGCVFSLAWDPANVAAGASGAIFGVLAAFLAFMVRQRSQLPASILRAHWLSTLLFVAFSLVSGFLQDNVDNAAHLGGMLTGFTLGWLLARPLQPEERSRWPVWQGAGALLLVAAVALGGAWQVRGIGAELNDFDRFGRDHPWYASGEMENLQKWQTLAARIGSGAISRAEMARQFRNEIQPFWADAHDRLTSGATATDATADDVTTLIRDFTRLRRDWAGALADSAENEDAQSAQEAMRLMQETDRIQSRIDRMAFRSRMEYRPRALRHSVAVNRARRLLGLDEWRCIERSPTAAGRVRGEHDSPEDAPALRYELGCRVQRLFHERDYRALEAVMRSAAADLNDLPDGTASLAAIFSALSTLIYQGNYDVEDVMGRTADWRRVVEDPLMAELVEVMIFQEWAWTARGHGGASEVSAMGWYLFGHRAEMAAAGLEAIEESGVGSPVWHDLSVDVALDLSRPKEEIRAAFDRGVERFPDYLPLYVGMLRVLMPRWLGSHDEVDRFIREQTAHDSRDPDLARYARLYWSYFLLEQDDRNIFTEAKASWPDVDDGFAELRRRHPASDYLLNAWAAMACVARDFERYATLRPEVGRRLSGPAWSDQYSLTKCDREMRWMR